MKANKTDLEDRLIDNMRFLKRKHLLRLVNSLRIWLVLRGISLWTIWVERNNFTFKITRWDVEKTQKIIWQRLLEYSKLAWNIACKDVGMAAIYDDALRSYDKVVGGVGKRNKHLYHTNNIKFWVFEYYSA